MEGKAVRTQHEFGIAQAAACRGHAPQEEAHAHMLYPQNLWLGKIAVPNTWSKEAVAWIFMPNSCSIVFLSFF